MTARSERGERIERLFTEAAARFDAGYESRRPSGRLVRARMDAVLDRLGDEPGAVLDVGMGTGRLCAALEERGWTAFGLDRTQEMVRLARERLPHARERLVRGIAEELPFAAESFDAVVATGALEYVDDLPRALAEAARVLRPQGRLVASYPNYRSPSSLVRGKLVYPAARAVKRIVPLRRSAPIAAVRPWSRAELEQLLAATSLTPEAVDRVGLLAPQLVVSARKQ